MSSGSKVCKAVQVLKEHQVSFGFVIIWCDVPSVEILLVDTFLFPQSYWKVPEDHIILINLFCTPAAARRIVDENPNVRSTFLPGALRKHFNVLRVLHPSDDRPNNGASLSDPKSLWPALLRHRSCGLGGEHPRRKSLWNCCKSVLLFCTYLNLWSVLSTIMGI